MFASRILSRLTKNLFAGRFDITVFVMVGTSELIKLENLDESIRI